MDAAESVVLYTWTFERYPLRLPPWPVPLANPRVSGLVEGDIGPLTIDIEDARKAPFKYNEIVLVELL